MNWSQLLSDCIHALSLLLISLYPYSPPGPLAHPQAAASGPLHFCPFYMEHSFPQGIHMACFLTSFRSLFIYFLTRVTLPSYLKYIAAPTSYYSLSSYPALFSSSFLLPTYILYMCLLSAFLLPNTSSLKTGILSDLMTAVSPGPKTVPRPWSVLNKYAFNK